MTDGPSIYRNIASVLVSEHGDETVSEVADILAEDILDPSKERDQFNYLMRIEQYFDECDLYAYDGWADAEISRAPDIEKFWVTVDLYVEKDTDMAGALRIRGKEEQNDVRVAPWGKGKIVRCRILRRILDGIEDRNRRMAAKEVQDKLDG